MRLCDSFCYDEITTSQLRTSRSHHILTIAKLYIRLSVIRNERERNVFCPRTNPPEHKQQFLRLTPIQPTYSLCHVHAMGLRQAIQVFAWDESMK